MTAASGCADHGCAALHVTRVCVCVCLQSGRTALLAAAEAGHAAVVEALLAAGADANVKDEVWFWFFLTPPSSSPCLLLLPTCDATYMY